LEVAEVRRSNYVSHWSEKGCIRNKHVIVTYLALIKDSKSKDWWEMFRSKEHCFDGN
jgi:hypothetical protein